jgi:hypothetical protein
MAHARVPYSCRLNDEDTHAPRSRSSRRPGWLGSPYRTVRSHAFGEIDQDWDFGQVKIA